jgi:transcriptional regulator with XRE-family HTH domain
MNKTDQKIFYKAFGACVQHERVRVGLTINQLAKESGEQNKTIRHIESGERVSMHHMIWAGRVLNITYDIVLHYINSNYRELVNGEENIKEGIQSLSDFI